MDFDVYRKKSILSIDFVILQFRTFKQLTLLYLIWICGLPVHFSFLFHLEHLYATLHDLPSSYLENPYVATIIPAFSFTQKLVKPSKCHSLDNCVK